MSSCATNKGSRSFHLAVTVGDKDVDGRQKRFCFPGAVISAQASVSESSTHCKLGHVSPDTRFGLFGAPEEARWARNDPAVARLTSIQDHRWIRGTYGYGRRRRASALGRREE